MTIKYHRTQKLPPIIIYMLISILVAAIDTLIVWVMYRILHFELVTSNTTGVVTGSIIHYRLSSKSVFKTPHGLFGFVIYVITFLFGLVCADWLIYFGEYRMFTNYQENIRFLLSKSLSVLVPFFLLYFIRKFLFYHLNKPYDSSNNPEWKDKN